MRAIATAITTVADFLGLTAPRAYALGNTGWTVAVERRGTITTVAGRHARDGKTFSLAMHDDGAFAGTDARGRLVEGQAEL